MFTVLDLNPRGTLLPFSVHANTLLKCFASENSSSFFPPCVRFRISKQHVFPLLLHREVYDSRTRGPSATKEETTPQERRDLRLLSAGELSPFLTALVIALLWYCGVSWSCVVFDVLFLPPPSSFHLSSTFLSFLHQHSVHLHIDIKLLFQRRSFAILSTKTRRWLTTATQDILDIPRTKNKSVTSSSTYHHQILALLPKHFAFQWFHAQLQCASKLCL